MEVAVEQARLEEKFSSLHRVEQDSIVQKIQDLKDKIPDDTGLFPVEFIKIYLSSVNNASNSLLKYEKEQYDPMGEIPPKNYWPVFEKWILPYVSQIFIQQFNSALAELSINKELSIPTKQALEQTYNQYVGRFGKRIQNDINKTLMETQNQRIDSQPKPKVKGIPPTQLIKDPTTSNTETLAFDAKEIIAQSVAKQELLKKEEKIREEINQQETVESQLSNETNKGSNQIKKSSYVLIALIIILIIIFLLAKN